MKKQWNAALAAVLATVTLSVFAQGALPPVEGEVRKVDPLAQKITLRHQEIPNIEMSPMTMVFRVRDPALLAQVKEGDKVRFTADKIDGALTVLSIERTN